ncbi:MAG: relaxase/mobilization nuclease domain-containing protein [Richelia sp. SM2_1_7]|nr:relaxase/mobilization nuclease domain-containing protein [Richelia sp. SM2_1_7]
MIGNITKGNGFYGCVAYVLGKENAQLINSNMASTTPTDLAWEFRKFAQLNQRVEKPVLHISLNPAPSDRILDEWEMCMIAQDLMEGLELKNNQFILVQHTDTEYEGKTRPHMHLVVNRVGFDGKCNDDYLDHYRIQKVLRQIEKEYDLMPTPSSWEVEKKKAYPIHILASGELNIVEKLQNAIALAASDKPEMPVFVARLLKDNIQVNCRFTRTGKLKGISYCMEGEAFKGGDLGKLYTHIGIREHLGVGYQQHYSDPISSLMESYKRGRTINDELIEHLQSWCRNQESVKNISKPEEVEYSNNESAPQQTQSVETIPVPLESIPISPIKRETQSPTTSDDVYPEIITNNNNNSNSTNESITDNTNVVEPPQKDYISVVPSIESVFGTPLSNKAKKQLNINKVKNNNKVTSFPNDNTDAVTPPRPAYNSVVPSIESIFPSPKDSFEEKKKKNITQTDTGIESQPISTPEPEVIEPAIEPEAAKYAVIIAAYMASYGQIEIKGDTLHATLKFGCHRANSTKVR